MTGQCRQEGREESAGERKERKMADESEGCILVVANRTCLCPDVLDAVCRRAKANDGDIVIVAPALNSRVRHYVSDIDGAVAEAEERLAVAIGGLAERGRRGNGRGGRRRSAASDRRRLPAFHSRRDRRLDVFAGAVETGSSAKSSTGRASATTSLLRISSAGTDWTRMRDDLNRGGLSAPHSQLPGQRCSRRSSSARAASPHPDGGAERRPLAASTRPLRSHPLVPGPGARARAARPDASADRARDTALWRRRAVAWDRFAA